MSKNKPTKSSVNASDENLPSVVRANLNRKVVQSPTFVSLYANDVQVQTSPWDVRLILGEIAGVPTPDDPTVAVRQIAELRMSPQLTKKLTIILIQQLKGYEAQFGPIPIPQD